jgi:hypothetical protein
MIRTWVSAPLPRWLLFTSLCLGAPFGARAADVPEDPQPAWLLRWFDPDKAPFIPVPEIDVDPDSGVTLGVIPTWLKSDGDGHISRIIAPDVIYSQKFGAGARGRIFDYLSDNSQWTLIAGGKQRVEREFDYEYQAGRLRQDLWSLNLSAVYDRSGTPRFYGIGNRSRVANETNYTLAQKFLQATLGMNISHELQLAYTVRARGLDVERGSLSDVPSIEKLYPNLPGIGTASETLHRLALIYDSRDDITVPTHGGEYVAFAGMAARHGVLNDSLYREFGVDVRHLWDVSDGNILVAHAALRYVPGHGSVPFWGLSSLGGAQSILADAQPLRGYGSGRFYDRNSFSASAEYRKRVLSFDAVTTRINVEVTPFVDLGKVYAKSDTSPVTHLHTVTGVGFRGIAPPFVVGYVDVGYGSDGAAVFTGINYPF